MTTLGSLLVVPAGRANGKTSAMPLDIPGVAASLAVTITAAGHSVGHLGDLASLIADLTAWTQQDDDAHEPCSLTACRHPLHPGPCKGWKGTLHAVAPGTYKQIEEARVEKANARRVKRIADLRAQGKPIPRRLLEEIKPKPAPVHPAHNAQAVPLGQVNQKADLAGGQAHAAGQAVSKAAGVTVKTAPPLPLGPKKQKPTVAGRGPAFVITQPKVTDQYKLDKASKITPQEWAALSDADKTTIRNELTAIKARGFGPQQKKSDELLAKLPAPGAARPAPGKITLGQATKTQDVSGTPPTPAKAAPTSQPSAAPKVLPPHAQAARAVAARTLGGAPTAKKHLTAYGQLSKDDFDNLDATTQRTIRDDLANAKAKFLDPKKQQEAADLLDRFGSRHTSPAPGAPAVPVNPKGYSDPQVQAVKAVRSGTADTALKTVGALSRPTISGLDDGDRKALLARLALIATHPKATQDQKERATAYGRIINRGPHTDPGKLDHEPSLGELHAHEQKNPAGHPDVVAALKATEPSSTSGLSPQARITALISLPKAQFDSLDPADQRKIADALQSLHVDRSDPYNTKLDTAVGDAIRIYTGLHPAIHRLQQAEADFRAGVISGDQVEARFRTARVQAIGPDQATRDAVDAEAARIAKDNPTLPTYARVGLAGEPKYGNTTYSAISLAGMKHDWEPAPRFNAGDFRDLFRPTDADLAAADPIHAQAVRDLQEHVLATGLRGQPGVPTGSPWSLATRNAAIDALLNTDSYGEISRIGLARYKELTPATQGLIRRAMRDRLNSQSNASAKTETWIGMRELEGAHPLAPAKLAAVRVAADRVPPTGAIDDIRGLTPDDFDDLPSFAQDALRGHLAKFQGRAEARGPVRTWADADDALKVMPAALMAHLAGSRPVYADRRLAAASDIANYGQKIINPHDRTRVYGDVPVTRFRDMTATDRAMINADLDSIAHDPANPLPIRYNAQFAKDVQINSASPLNLDQLVAVASVSPTPIRLQPDSNVIPALDKLTKADFDSLDSVFKDAIDERLKSVVGPQRQLLTAKFHPQAPAATPGGFTPTAPASVQAHVQTALDTIYGVHPKSHTMAHQLSTYGALRGSDFAALNGQEQGHLLGDLSFIATTAKGPSADKARKLIDRFTPPGTPAGQVPTGAIIPPANAVPGQVRYATPLKGLAKAQDSGKSGDGWISLPGGQRVWGAHGAAGLLLQHVDQNTGEKRYLMVQRGPAISDPGKWTFPGGASDSKETPHQGATRETIEELGLKDDVFKDALVHGDHTFTIPGSTWKYTTVAAQVPTMIKPDLSTAHARAETSDAKWMTLAEIQALDKSGKLHGPIANGKLEQNVISLYPQTTAQKLGQVARPGPVSKRLKRLDLPPAGRQGPASYNAWPHAHKPSTGKNLVADKAAIDAQRQKIKQDRVLYDGKTADGRLAAIGAQQGFDAVPTVMDKKDIDRLLATGDYIEAWRGVSGAGGYSARSRGGSGGKTAADINEEMRSGPAYYGKGIFGNGYYLATQRRVAAQYADSTHGSIARILIPKSAVMEKYDKVEKEAQANSSRTSKAKGSSSYEISTFWDPGRWGAAKGLDGIEINPHHRAHAGGGASHVAAHGKPAFNWLNRSVLIIQKEPG